MKIGIVCKVIDNFGDAGVSLRLAKAMARHSHEVVLFHDHPGTFDLLYPSTEYDNLQLINAAVDNFSATRYSDLDLVLEPFGTSSEDTKHRFDLALKQVCPQAAWLLIDYLSCEKWVEDFHLGQSTDPTTGHITTYFYPGFTARTGGLVHEDYPEHLRSHENSPVETGQQSAKHLDQQLFVFAYPNAPFNELLSTCEDMNRQGGNFRIRVAGKQQPGTEHACLEYLPFCPQSEFDQLLAKHDWLFVRGEDSFVRAQLAGKPFVWQIYATADNAHAKKLLSFFDFYSERLSHECKQALWNCWQSWNRLENCPHFGESWLKLQAHWPELRDHAVDWQKQLFNGPELVREILSWHGRQNPTLIEKPVL